MTFDAVFHGSAVKIDRFDGEKAVHGFFFADRREVAINWANENAPAGEFGWLTTARVKLADPLVIDAQGAHWSEIQDPWDDDLERGIDEIAGDAAAAGFDGMVVKNIQDGPDTMDGATNMTIVAFYEEQVEIISCVELTEAESLAEPTPAPAPNAKRVADPSAHIEKLKVRLFRRRLPEKIRNDAEWYFEKCPHGRDNINARLLELVTTYPRVTTGWTPTSIRGHHEHWFAYRPHPALSAA